MRKYAVAPYANKIKTGVHTMKPRLYGSLFSGLFCILCFTLLTSLLYAEDKIIAIVDNEIITQKDLNDFVNFMRVQLSGEYGVRALEEKIDTIKSDLLNKLIEDRLILQEAKKNDVKIDESSPLNLSRVIICQKRHSLYKGRVHFLD